MEENQNLKLWSRVFETDKKQTKGFRKSGGFSGTAIKPFYIVQRLTEEFGPCGKGWGIDVERFEYIAGTYIVYARLWYLDKEDGVPYSVYAFGQTIMEGKNKNGDFVDEEAPKKALTDALTKAASWLGFGGDVHMGQFDGPYGDREPEPPAPSSTSKPPAPKGLEEGKELLRRAATKGPEELEKAKKSLRKEVYEYIRDHEKVFQGSLKLIVSAKETIDGNGK